MIQVRIAEYSRIERYQPAGKTSRDPIDAKLATCPLVRAVRIRRLGAAFDTIAGVAALTGVARAKASLGDRAAGGALTGAASAICAGGGTTVGKLVSITIRSGHLCNE